jgi:hypothetical protein
MSYHVDIGTIYETEIEAYSVLEYLEGDYEFLKEALGRCPNEDGFVEVGVSFTLEITLPGYASHYVEDTVTVTLEWQDVRNHISQELENLLSENKHLRERLSEEKSKVKAFEVTIAEAEAAGFIRAPEVAEAK